MSTEPLRVLSYGGGTQSAALALMSAAGDLPKLDAVVFADTQGELPETYLYAEYVERILDRAGIPFLRVTAGSLEQDLIASATCGRCSGSGLVFYSNTDDQDDGQAPDLAAPRECPRCKGSGRKTSSSNPTPPAHVLNPDGSKGRIGGYRCSYDYKRRVITRQVKQLCGGRGAWKRSSVEQWLGFSTDEVGRCKPADECRCGHKRLRAPAEKGGPARGHRPGCDACACEAFDPWQVNRWPLIELGYRREDTIRWFGEHGHPTPPRSACWFCPNSRNPRWASLKTEHPDLWERACQLDETIRNGGGFNARGNVPFAGKMFLHDSLIPLRNADLRAAWEREIDAGQGDLFDGAVLANECESGVCFT